MLKLMLMLSTLPTHMPPQSPMPMPEFPLDPALVLTPSPRVLMPPPRDIPLLRIHRWLLCWQVNWRAFCDQLTYSVCYVSRLTCSVPFEMSYLTCNSVGIKRYLFPKK